MTSIFDIIEEHEYNEISTAIESLKSDIEEYCEDVYFESIISGDNAVKRFLSKIGKAMTTFSNGGKIKFDTSVFEKIDKSKISKDVTGVATPEYVKVFHDIVLREPTFSNSDLNRLAVLTQKVTFKNSDAGLIARFISRSAGLTSWYFLITGIFVDASRLIIYLALELVSQVLRIYVINDSKYTTEKMTDAEVNEMLDLTCKLFNSFIGIDSTNIDSNSLSTADNIIDSLSRTSSTTISVADQNKVADMLLEVAKKYNQQKREITKYTMDKSYLKIYKEFMSDVKRGDARVRDMDDNMVTKMDNIVNLATKISTISDKMATASNTIMRDIRKW